MQTLKFLKPIFIGDKLTVEVVVTNFRVDRGIATMSTVVKKDNGEIAVKGDATIMTPSGVAEAHT